MTTKIITLLTLTVLTSAALAAPQSFGALLPYLDDAAVKNEAGLAVVAVATELVKNETTKPQAVEALKVVVEKCEDAGIRDSAQKILGN